MLSRKNTTGLIPRILVFRSIAACTRPSINPVPSRSGSKPSSRLSMRNTTVDVVSSHACRSAVSISVRLSAVDKSAMRSSGDKFGLVAFRIVAKYRSKMSDPAPVQRSKWGLMLPKCWLFLNLYVGDSAAAISIIRAKRHAKPRGRAHFGECLAKTRDPRP